MSEKRFLKFKEGLELLNSLDSDESDIEIAVLPGASKLTDEDEGNKNEVNTGEIIVKDVHGSLELINRDGFQAEPPTSSSVSTTKSRKKAKRHQLFWIKNKSRHYQTGKHRLTQLQVTCSSRWRLH
ncbi:hypothetical protein TNCV_2594821 [Trichonephila clavipes]|nr:hypothetical protein TNCV_2594821 [Trichonephila clavipes]